MKNDGPPNRDSIPGLHFVATRMNPFISELEEKPRTLAQKRYGHLLDLSEYRRGGKKGPRVWLFGWQEEILREGELRAGYEDDVMNHTSLACFFGRNCVLSKGGKSAKWVST